MKYIPLVQVCDFQGGSQPPKDQWIDHEKEGYIRMLQIRDFTQPDKENVEFVRISKTIKTCNEDDILIGRYGASVGKILTGLAGAYNVAIIKTIPDTSKLSKRFLYHYLNSPYFQNFILSVGSRAAQAGFNKDDLSDSQIPDLSLEEQSNVVSQLDKVTELIVLRKEQLAKLDQLVKSRFIELFGDPVDNPKNYLVKSLQELIDMGYITYHLDGNHGGDYPRSEEFVDSGVPYIGANSIVNGKIDFSMAKFLTAERAGKLRKGIAQNDDVLFAHNATVGPTVVLKTTEPKVILSTSLTAYRCNKSRLLPDYLKAYMQSDGFVRQYSGEMKQTTRNQVPITAQKKYLFLVPPIVEQEQFATFVKQTDKSKLAIQQSLDKLETIPNAGLLWVR